MQSNGSPDSPRKLLLVDFSYSRRRRCAPTDRQIKIDCDANKHLSLGQKIKNRGIQNRAEVNIS